MPNFYKKGLKIGSSVRGQDAAITCDAVFQRLVIKKADLLKSAFLFAANELIFSCIQSDK